MNTPTTEAPKRLNNRVEGNVQFWETYNDENYSNRHAQYRGVELFAFPHKDLSGQTEERMHIKVWNQHGSGYCWRSGRGLDNGDIDYGQGDKGFNYDTLPLAIKGAVNAALAYPQGEKLLARIEEAGVPIDDLRIDQGYTDETRDTATPVACWNVHYTRNTTEGWKTTDLGDFARHDDAALAFNYAREMHEKKRNGLPPKR